MYLLHIKSVAANFSFLLYNFRVLEQSRMKYCYFNMASKQVTRKHEKLLFENTR